MVEAHQEQNSMGVMQDKIQHTLQQYDAAVAACRQIFLDKSRDYGTSWRVLRPVSIVDQIFIKAQRIRNIQELGVQKIDEQIDNEFKGIVNYGIIALIQLGIKADAAWELSVDETAALYDREILQIRALMQDKNHDYGEAWRSMSQESFVDLILMKLLRIRQILQHEGKTIVSEGIDANFTDIVNYAIFALIRISEMSKNPPA
jgi:hypothetical protein